MLPATFTTKVAQLCAAIVGVPVASAEPALAIVGRSGALLHGNPRDGADAEATVRHVVCLDADVSAGPLDIDRNDSATFGVTPATVSDSCPLARAGNATSHPRDGGSATLTHVSALLRQAFGARITDTIRPVNAMYGARYSWHKAGQAIDFVPSGGVRTINRGEVRSLMTQNGIRLIELLGPGDRGHSNHWHLAFARPGQIVDVRQPIEGEEDWVLDIANVGSGYPASQKGAPSASAPTTAATRSPPAWDVFAVAQWRVSRGSGS